MAAIISSRTRFWNIFVAFAVLASTLASPLNPLQKTYAAPPGNAPESELETPHLLPTAAVTLNAPASVMIGQAFSFTASFDNSSPDETGYGPFIDIVFPVLGADGAGGADDGIDFAGATYLGAAVTAVQNTFGAQNTGGCTGGLGPVSHPYAVALTTGARLVVCGTPGNKLVTLLLPFGSFTPAQPPAVVTVNATLSSLADAGSPLSLRARGGYQFGATPLNDWCCGDASIVSHSGASSGWPASPVAPAVFTLTKTYGGLEDETATGPNFPHQYTLTVDIAAGQTVTALTVTDSLPNTMQFVSLASSSPAAACSSTPSTSTPGGTLACDFGTVTGGAGASDATLTFNFYIPLSDAGGSPVIDAAGGDDVTATNTSGSAGSWDPIDGRDPVTPVTAGGVCPDGCHSLTAKSIAIQKTVANVIDVGVSGNSPGDTLEYTLDFQVSDFFTFGAISISDILSDGQRLTGTPALTISDRDGAFSGSFTLGGDLVVDDSQFPPGGACGDGQTRLTFNVSQARLNLGGPDGVVTGGQVNAGAFGGATGRVTFRAIIQNDFACNYPSLDPSVDHGDLLGNTVAVNAEVYDNHTQLPQSTPQFESDDSGASLNIAFGGLNKSVYAVNGAACPNAVECPGSGPYRIKPADVVTYRLRYTQPSSDFEATTLTDYLPLPVFKSGDPDADGAAGPAWTQNLTAAPPPPPAAQWKYGPADTFHLRPGASAPTLTVNATNNTLAFSYPPYDDPSNTTSEIDLLFTVAASSDPFADQLYLTNQAHAVEGTTNAGDQELETIVQVILTEPVLTSKKGVVATDNPAGTFAPALGSPVFNAPGSAGARWTGIINSSNAANVATSNLSGVDAGDLVTFAIVIQNTGTSPKGAFDLTITDVLAAGYVVPAGGINLRISYGDPAQPALTFAGLGGGPDGTAGTADDLFGSGIRIDDPGAPGAGACQVHNVANGLNIIVITYDLQLDPNITLAQSIINTASLTRYAGSEGGPNHLSSPLSDTATVTPITAPVKSIVSTSETHTSETGTGATNNPRLAAIGEIVRYRLTVGVPEGIIPDFRLRDNLPGGLIFLDDNTARAAFISTFGNVTSSTLNGAGLNYTGDETTVGGVTPTFLLPDSAVSAAAASDDDTYTPGAGTDVYFKLGDVNNPDRDTGLEFVVIEFNALVENISSNGTATNLDNTVTYRVGTSTSDSTASNTVRVRVVQPSIAFGKTIVSLPSPLDAGGIVQYQLSYANGTGANASAAFEVNITDPLPAQLALNLAEITVTLAGGAAGVTDNSAGNNLNLTINTVPVGGIVVVNYTATINDITTPAEIITNTSIATWTSLPGSGTNPNVTGSKAGEAGGPTGERTGTGVSPNTYRSSSTRSFTTGSPAILKQLTATSAAHTPGTDVTIGEEITYSLLLTFAEGTIPADTVVDDLPSGLAVIPDTPEVILTAAASGGLLAADFAGTIGTQSIIPVAGDGGSLTFGFTNVALSGDNNISNNTILLRFRARVTDVAGNVGFPTATVLSNQATNQVGTGTPTSSELVTTTLVEPRPVIVKSFTPNAGSLNDVVRVTLTYQNTGTSTAYDVVVSDALGATKFTNLTPVTTPAGFNFSTSGINPVTLLYAAGPGVAVIPGANLVFEFDLTLADGVVPGELLPNTANVTHTTTLDSAAVDGDDANERNATASGSDNLTVNPTDLAITKSHTGDFTAGVYGTFTIRVQNVSAYPATGVITVSDSLPAQLDYVSAAGVGWTCSYAGVTRAVTCTYPGPLAGGATLPDISLTVNPNTNGTFNNTASVSITGTDSNPANDSDTDTVTLGSPLPIEKLIPVPPSGAIGETITYDIRVTPSEGTTPSLSVTDDLPAGLGYVSHEIITTAADSSANLAADFDGTLNTSPTCTGCANGSSGMLTFAFGDVTVTNDGDPADNAFLVRVVAQVLNVAANQAGTSLTNTADFTYTNKPAGSTASQQTITVNEPDITLGKTILSLPVELDAGGQVTYRITLANPTGASVSTAYDLQVTDRLPNALTLNPLPGSVVVTTSGTVGAVDISHTAPNTPPGTPSQLDVRIASLAPGSSVQVDYTATINDSVTPAQVIDNTGEAAWTSQSGMAAGERSGVDGPGGALDDYAATAEASFTTDASASLVKQLALTSASHTPADQVAVGEELTYAILLTLPEGTTPAETVVDNLPQGLEYIPGTAEVVSLAADSGGQLAADFNGAIGTASISAVPGEGGSVTFAFTNITAAGDNLANNNTLLLRLQARVLNVVGSQDGSLLTNEAALGTGSEPFTSTVDVSVLEPQLSVTKTVNDPYPVGGQAVTFTVVVEHTSASSTDAFDALVIDNLPAGLALDLASVSTTATGGVSGVADSSTGNQVRIEAGIFPSGGRLTITYQATVTAGLGTAVDNLANLTWTSLPGTPVSERTGADGIEGELNDYADSSSAVIATQRDLVKRLLASNFAGTNSPAVAIGEILTYELVLSVPPAHTDSYTIVDSLDPGLAFVDCEDITAGTQLNSTAIDLHAPGNCSHGSGASSNPRITQSGGTLSFDFGSITNTSQTGSEDVTIRYRAVVLDTPGNLRGVTLDNSARVTWSTGTQTRTALPVRIVEPDLGLEKTVSTGLASPGMLLTYRLRVFHTGDSLMDGFDVVLTDIVPEGVLYQPGSLVFVTGSGAAPTRLDDSTIDPVSGQVMLSAGWDNLPLGQEAVIEFTARFGDIPPNGTVTNTASLEWTSLPGAVPAPPAAYLSIYNPTYSHERRYDPSNPADVYRVDSSIAVRAMSLPETGFAPGRVTLLPPQGEGQLYTSLDDLRLEIPRLGINIPIVGVPVGGEGWDLTWLWGQAGYLEGTAYPGLPGNTALTAHVYLPDGKPGPFASLGALGWGDQVILHANGQRYIYEVRSNHQVLPGDTSILGHEEYSWLTLITCKGFDEASGGYRYRQTARAVLLRVEPETGD